MSMESDLFMLLQGICPSAYPDVAPAGAPLPYIVWQGLGGESLRYGDGTAPARRNTYLQVAVWAESRAAALALIHQVEDALCASPAFSAIEPQGEAMSTYELATQRYGSIQRFDLWAAR